VSAWLLCTRILYYYPLSLSRTPLWTAECSTIMASVTLTPRKWLLYSNYRWFNFLMKWKKWLLSIACF